MTQKQMFERFILAKGEEAFTKLQAAKIMLIGCGAVGGYALEQLARCGVKSFVVVDCDRFELSNLNRQILCTHETLGMPKVDAAEKRVVSINPEASVVKVFEKVDGARVEQLYEEHSPSLIVDCIDLFQQKSYILQLCVDKHIPAISSMGAARRNDMAKVTVQYLQHAYGCPLCKKVKKQVAFPKDEECRNVACIVSVEKAMGAGDGDGPLPSYSIMTSTFGIWVAYAAVERLINGYFPVSK